jgi:hypothetical protein
MGRNEITFHSVFYFENHYITPRPAHVTPERSKIQSRMVWRREHSLKRGGIAQKNHYP